MDIRQIIRLVTFGYENMLPNILSYWVLAILPEIMFNNLGVTDKETLSLYCGMFFSTFFWGIMIGSLMWPSAVRYMSKRTAILISIFGLGLFNFLMGCTSSLSLVLLFRFLAGLFHNLNSVGKDFIYQFARPKYRLYAFSVKTLFTFVASFLGPWAGYQLYVWCDNDFNQSIYYISILFVIGVILFIAVFFFDFKNGDAEHDHHFDEEEAVNILEEIDFKKEKGLWEVFKFCMQSDYLRNLIIVYFLTNGVYKTSTIMAIWYMETPWADDGYGVTSYAVSIVGLISFIPAATLILLSPKFVPSKISYKGFIMFFISSLTFVIFLFPFVRDILPDSYNTHSVWISYLLLAFLFASVPKLYSPFINYNLNNRVDKYSRTSLNSLTFILSSASAALFATIVSPLLSYSLYNRNFSGHFYSKYLAFVVLDIGLIISLLILRKIN